LIADLTDTSTAAQTITVGSVATITLALGTDTTGDEVVTGTALTDTQTLTMTGSNNVTVSVGLGDLSAAAYTGAMTVTTTDTGTNVITTGSGNDVVTGGTGADTIVTGDGADTITVTGGGTITAGVGADAITMNGTGDYILVFSSALTADTVTNTAGWASAGNDKIHISMGGISVGNADNTVDNGATGDGNTVGATAELYVVTTNSADITAANAAAAAGPAAIANLALGAAVAAGGRKILAFDDGADTAVYLFVSAANDTTILAAELTLIGFFSGVAATAHGDYAFIT
jgi:hypothetical protein